MEVDRDRQTQLALQAGLEWDAGQGRRYDAFMRGWCDGCEPDRDGHRLRVLMAVIICDMQVLVGRQHPVYAAMKMSEFTKVMLGNLIEAMERYERREPVVEGLKKMAAETK